MRCTARLDAGSGPFREAFDRLEETGHAARAARGEGPAADAWGAALTTVARRLESAWLALEEALASEWVALGARCGGSAGLAAAALAAGPDFVVLLF